MLQGGEDADEAAPGVANEMGERSFEPADDLGKVIHVLPNLIVESIGDIDVRPRVPARCAKGLQASAGELGVRLRGGCPRR